MQLFVEADPEGGTTDTFSRDLCWQVVLVPGATHKCNVHVTPKIVSAVKTLNFLANDDRMFDRCLNGITPFCTPWRLAKAVNSGMAVECYFQEVTLKSLVDIKKFATGTKFNTPQSLHGLTRIFINYIRLLEVLLGDQCHHLHRILWLRDGLDLHKHSLESYVTPLLMINLLL